MNKTQTTIVSRLVNRGHNNGSVKVGWTITNTVNDKTKGICFMSLFKLNEINQAYGLADKYPDVFGLESKGYRLTWLFLKDDLKARQLLERYELRT